MKVDEMSKIKAVFWLLLFVPCVAIAQHPQHNNAEFNIKKHTTNAVTVQVDSIDASFGRLVGAHQTFHADSADTDTLWVITGTGMDTSRAYISWPYMALYYSFTDTAASSDSIDLIITLYSSAKNEYLNRRGATYPRSESEFPTPFGFYAQEKTLTITSSGVGGSYTESAIGRWILTETAIGNGQWLYITVKGNSNKNKTLSAVTGWIRASFWDGDVIR